MINVIVASHGPMAKAMLETANMIVGEMPYCFAVTLTGEAGIEGFKQDFAQVLEQASRGADGVLVLCDMQSGTPWNVACTYAFSASIQPPVAVLGGVNLPMLLQTDEIHALTEVRHAASLLLTLTHPTLVLASPASAEQSDEF
ncbi:PTS fructose transporter subunit IIA [Enterobacter oligotrophicus]|uniref:PTS sugar transporter subunit IIA n=1 Tax=Enterobacter TaxID=547 RepID=UPI001C023111|nr:PTS fructose transporter subunit IIA [Enterobacter oligotrophicus]ELW1646897.1 PTS fructose transporter subunit IIA [Enterobacter oligotrophicus]MBT9426727.1 PTS fructose transporter subunit IIA [Enterobacter oligotrophicus]